MRHSEEVHQKEEPVSNRAMAKLSWIPLAKGCSSMRASPWRSSSVQTAKAISRAGRVHTWGISVWIPRLNFVPRLRSNGGICCSDTQKSALNGLPGLNHWSARLFLQCSNNQPHCLPN